jgi:hypothetical protein
MRARFSVRRTSSRSVGRRDGETTGRGRRLHADASAEPREVRSCESGQESVHAGGRLEDSLRSLHAAQRQSGSGALDVRAHGRSGVDEVNSLGPHGIQSSCSPLATGGVQAGCSAGGALLCDPARRSRHTSLVGPIGGSFADQDQQGFAFTSLCLPPVVVFAGAAGGTFLHSFGRPIREALRPTGAVARIARRRGLCRASGARHASPSETFPLRRAGNKASDAVGATLRPLESRSTSHVNAQTGLMRSRSSGVAGSFWDLFGGWAAAATGTRSRRLLRSLPIER